MAKNVKKIYWEDVNVGQDLPETARDIDYTLIACGAVWATHDFMPVHHNPEFAKQQGAPNIFMNILTSNGLVGAYLTEWSGPEGELRHLKIGLAVPNFPNDRMTMNGTIEKKWKEGKEHLVQIRVIGENQMGPHVTGTAIMALPTKR
jgi:acyl dehydratase